MVHQGCFCASRLSCIAAQLYQIYFFQLKFVFTEIENQLCYTFRVLGTALQLVSIVDYTSHATWITMRGTNPNTQSAYSLGKKAKPNTILFNKIKVWSHIYRG